MEKITISVTPEEKASFVERSHDLGITVNEYIRRLGAIGQAIPAVRGSDEQAFVHIVPMNPSEETGTPFMISPILL